MLVLSRKIGERIHIGENITIEIRRVAGNRVTLALDAPREVRILRGELEKAAREFQESSETKPATAEFEVADFHECCDSQANDTIDTKSGPEPYAVIQRRMCVVPGFSPPTLTRDYVI